MFRTLFLRLLLSGAVAAVGFGLAFAVNIAMGNASLSDPIAIVSLCLGGLAAACSVGAFVYGLATMADKKTEHLQR